MTKTHRKEARTLAILDAPGLLGSSSPPPLSTHLLLCNLARVLELRSTDLVTVRCDAGGAFMAVGALAGCRLSTAVGRSTYDLLVEWRPEQMAGQFGRLAIAAPLSAPLIEAISNCAALGIECAVVSGMRRRLVSARLAEHLPDRCYHLQRRVAA